MLQFNPYFRVSVNDALEHPFFTKVRKPYKEKEADKLISLDFENEELNRDRLRELFVSIISDVKVTKEAERAAAATATKK